ALSLDVCCIEWLNYIKQIELLCIKGESYMTEKDPSISCAIPNESRNDSSKKPAEIKADGSFNRQTNRFTTPFGNNRGEQPVEVGRYSLLWSAACPWAHRAVIVLKILGLENTISVGKVSPLRPRIERVDWEFSLDKDSV